MRDATATAISPNAAMPRAVRLATTNAVRDGRTHPVVDVHITMALAERHDCRIRIAATRKHQDAIEDDVPDHKGEDEPERGRKFC